MKAMIFMLMLPISAGAHCFSGFSVERGLIYVSTAVDFASTRAVNNVSKEANPLLGQSVSRQLGIMAGSALLTDCLTNYLDRRGSKSGPFIRKAVIGAHFGASAWNFSLRWRF